LKEWDTPIIFFNDVFYCRFNKNNKSSIGTVLGIDLISGNFHYSDRHKYREVRGQLKVRETGDYFGENLINDLSGMKKYL